MTGANELVADIHDRMPVILAPGTASKGLSGMGWSVPEPARRRTLRIFSGSSCTRRSARRCIVSAAIPKLRARAAESH